MAGLDPAIHVFARLKFKTWMPATSAGMTCFQDRNPDCAALYPGYACWGSRFPLPPLAPSTVLCTKLRIGVTLPSGARGLVHNAWAGRYNSLHANAF